MPAVYGLIDGNSFYCSAERAFAPGLRSHPVVDEVLALLAEIAKAIRDRAIDS